MNLASKFSSFSLLAFAAVSANAADIGRVVVRQ